MIETVLVKLASRCNLDCSYCYVYRMGNDGWRSQPKRMAKPTLERLAQRLSELRDVQGRPFAVVFHGGEPLLVGPAGFAEACSVLRRALPADCPLALQTNGVLLSDAVVSTCLLYDVGVSVSLDGASQAHDRNRPDMKGAPTHAAVLRGISRLRGTRAGRALFSGVLCVVDLDADPVETYEALKATGAPSIDLLYRDGNHDVLPPGKASSTSGEYGAWMSRLLDHYLADREPTPIRVLDDMFKLLLGGAATKEGVGIGRFGILVVETDGTVAKNDTLKSAHRLADRFERAPSIHDRSLADILVDDAYVAYERSEEPAEICMSCPDFGICGGGMPAHRWNAVRGFDNPSVFCADQRRLAADMRMHLRRAGLAA